MGDRMNPREFCRATGYSCAIFFTYDFHPVFFERVVLPDLWAGGVGDILVVADSTRVDASIDRWHRVVHLGRRYQLVRAAVKGAFHPKIILRAGREGAMVWLGTGNLTFGGWGGNREMSGAWSLTRNDASWIRGLFEQAADWCPGEADHNVVERARSLPFVDSVLNSEHNDPGQVLLSSGSRSLATQIVERWGGRQFSEVRILSGSTDRDGVFLNWMHNQFGVERATVAVDPGSVSFDPELLAGLDLDVQIVEPAFSKPLHAKVFEFSGPDGSAAIMGSANCSRSAWLRSPEDAGNIEAVLVFDESPEDLGSEMSRVFEDGTPFTPNPSGRVDEGSSRRSLRFRISEITRDPRDSEITIRFLQTVPKNTAVTVTVGGRSAACRPTSPDSLTWTVVLPLDEQAGARFATVSVLTDDGYPAETYKHWVNDREELIHAAKGRLVEDVIKRLRGSHIPAEQKQIIRELQKIGSVILDDRDAFPDPRRAAVPTEDRKNEEAETVSPVDPESLIRSLDDLPERHGPNQVGQFTGFSLVGVMRALFPEKRDVVMGDAVIDETGDRTLVTRSTDSGEESVQVPIQRRLLKGMERFITGFRNPEFAESCSARQLVQAAAYPLAVGIIGSRSGWLSGDDAALWARQVSDALFEMAPRSVSRSTGILGHVESRYESDGREEIFREVVGDGTLWLALLSSLSFGTWSGRRAAFERSLALRSVLISERLLGSADVTRIARLVKRADWDSKKVLAEASRKARVLNGLEKELRSRWDELIRLQERMELEHEPGDFLWNRKVGWAIAEAAAVASGGGKLTVYLRRRAEAVTVIARLYVNVTKRVEFEAALRELNA